MTVPVAQIVADRLKIWAADAVRDHATPMLMLCVGHDHVSGEVHLYVPDDPAFDKEAVRRMLRMALRELDRL